MLEIIPQLWRRTYSVFIDGLGSVNEGKEIFEG